MEKKIKKIGISVMLEADLYKAIKALSKVEVRSLNFMLNKAVRFYIENKDRSEDKQHE